MKKRAFTLIELLSAVAITIMICVLLSMTLGGIQRSISLSRKGLDFIAEAEFIFQLIQRDLKNMISSELSQPVLYPLKDRSLHLFLSNTKGYQSNRKLSLIGYSVDGVNKGMRLKRVSCSVDWGKPIFGDSMKDSRNLLNGDVFGLSPEFLKGNEDEISNHVLDFSFYYRYRDLKKGVEIISDRPMKDEFKLEAITVGMVVANAAEVTLDERTIKNLLKEKAPMEVQFSRGEWNSTLPWLKRFEEVNEILKEIKDRRFTAEYFYRTVEVGL